MLHVTISVVVFDIICDLFCILLIYFEDALPEGFSQQFEEQQHRPRAKFCSPVSQREHPPRLTDKKKKENSPETKVINEIYLYVVVREHKTFQSVEFATTSALTWQNSENRLCLIILSLF